MVAAHVAVLGFGMVPAVLMSALSTFYPVTIGLPGVGTLSIKAIAAHTGVKPGKAEKIQIPAGKKVSFKIATDLQKSL